MSDAHLPPGIERDVYDELMAGLLARVNARHDNLSAHHQSIYEARHRDLLVGLSDLGFAVERRGVDYRALLVKYIRFMGSYEGTTHLGGELNAWATESGITPEEWAELTKLDQERRS